MKLCCQFERDTGHVFLTKFVFIGNLCLKVFFEIAALLTTYFCSGKFTLSV
jgi:hypothetical protein